MIFEKILYEEVINMERALTTLEIKAISNNVGREEVMFLVCAVCSGTRVFFSNIDRIRSCTDRDHIPKLKKELKTEFPRDDMKVLIIKVRRIE
jgi:hypothetical protein